MGTGEATDQVWLSYSALLPTHQFIPNTFLDLLARHGETVPLVEYDSVHFPLAVAYHVPPDLDLCKVNPKQLAVYKSQAILQEIFYR